MLRLLTVALLTLLAFAAHAQTLSINGDVTLGTSTYATNLSVTGPLPLIGTIPSDPNCPAFGSVTVSNNLNGGISIEVSGYFQNQAEEECSVSWRLNAPPGMNDVEVELVVPASPLPAVPVVFSLESPGIPSSQNYHSAYLRLNKAMRGASEAVQIIGTSEMVFENSSPTSISRSSALAVLVPDDRLIFPLEDLGGLYQIGPGEPPVTLDHTVVLSATAVPGSIGSSVASLGGWGLAMLVLGIVIGVQLRLRARK